MLYLLIVSVVLVGTSFIAAATSEKKNDYPVRYQWGNNHGYCGETSLIVAGLEYGQYLSQYDARITACGTKSQAKCEMLLGVSDVKAATAMGFRHKAWDANVKSTTQDYLVWVKQAVIRGELPIIGVYMNYYEFYGDTNPKAGLGEYDHIVPVIGIKSKHPLDPKDDTYYGDDIITFSDNGLYGDSRTDAQYKYSYTFDKFQKSRAAANAKKGDIYSIPSDELNYAISITGLKDPANELRPVKVSTSVNYEAPEIKEGSTTRPASMTVTLKVKVSDLAPGKNYNLYRYNNLSKVPTKNFNSESSKASERWKIKGDANGVYTMSKTIKSNEVAVFRCVEA